MGKKNTEETLSDETNQLVREILSGEVGGIIGGSPCQDVSVSGTKSGILGDASGTAFNYSGLWWVMFRIFCLVRPKFWLMENVAGLLDRGMGTVLGSLACVGSDAEWDCVSAGIVGAPHEREREYILAHPVGLRLDEKCFPQEIQRQREFSMYDGSGFADFRERPDVSSPQLCGAGNGVAKRLHGIGNCNPPCVIRELTRGLK